MKKNITKMIAAAAALALMATASFSTAMPTVMAISNNEAYVVGENSSVGMSLIAGGSEIGIKFHLPEGSSESYIELDGEEAEVLGSDSGCFVITAENAMNMMKVHTISSGSTTPTELAKVSVCDYLNEIIKGGMDYEQFKPLAKAMLMYGAAAQEYFGVEADGSPADGITGADYSGISINSEPFDKAAFNSVLENAPVTYYGMNLSLRSRLSFTLFFSLNSGVEMADAKEWLSGFTFGGAPAQVRENGTSFLEISVDVPASELDKALTLTNGSISADFSPAQYLAAAVGLGDDKLTNVCKALYAYGTEAKNLSGASPSADEKWMSDTVHSGKATVYDLASGGCANLDDFASLNNYETCALSVADYNTAEMAGAYLELTDANGSKAYVLVTDRDGNNNMQAGDVDIERNQFTQGGSFTAGESAITWRIMPLPTADTGSVSYQIKEGSTKYWCELQVRNHRYPIAKLEYKNASGEFEAVTRKDYNFFEFPNGINGNITLRITDIYGEQIVEENIDLGLGVNEVTSRMTVPGTVQFTK